MTTDGWQPDEGDENPSVGFDMDEDAPFMDVTFDTENVDKVRIVVTDTNGVVVLNDTFEVYFNVFFIGNKPLIFRKLNTF